MTSPIDQSVILRTCSDLTTLKPIWEQLNRDRIPEDIAGTFPGLEAWASNDPTPKPLSLLIAQRQGRPIGILPLRKTPRRHGKIRLNVLEPLGNDHWRTASPIVGCNMEQSLADMLHALCQQPDWDMLELGPLPENGAILPALIVQGHRLKMRPMIAARIEDPIVNLHGSWENYQSHLSGNLRSQIKRGESKLQRQGEMRLEEYRGGNDLEAKLEEFFRIEASGWKGRQGTAIANDPHLRGFYTQLARETSQRGWLRLYLLRVGKHCVAADYCLAYRGTISMLKVGYDENWSHCSPGQVMRKQVLEHLFRTRQDEIYDLMSGGGEHRDYKLRWSNQIRQQAILRLFRPHSLRGQLLARLCHVRNWFRRVHDTFSERISGRTDIPVCHGWTFLSTRLVGQTFLSVFSPSSEA
jgi:CelD/BcsL family acetyltransferase involved in cellulose biosynthesis